MMLSLTRSASFVQAFAKIGLVPDTGGTWLLPRLAGRARALGMAMLAERVSAEDAERWGLIWKCVDDAKLMEEANAMARALGRSRAMAQGEAEPMCDVEAALPALKRQRC